MGFMHRVQIYLLYLLFFRGDICIKCEEGYYNYGINQCKKCLFDESNKCCYFTCKTCFGVKSNECSSCEPDDKRIDNGSNECVCMNGYVEDNTICKPCHYSCKTCDVMNVNDCKSCESNDYRILKNSN